MAAVDRIPLGTASALEFLGPLWRRGRTRQGPPPPGLARAGCSRYRSLTEPWAGAVNPVGVLFALGAAVCWACYILLTQRADDEVTGINALAVSMPRRRSGCDHRRRPVGFCRG